MARHRPSLHQSAILLAATLYSLRSVQAEHNVTVWPSDPSVVYLPQDQWLRATSDGDGQQAAMTAKTSGAKASFSFVGTAIFMQVEQGPNNAMAVVNLDGTAFSFDTKSADGDKASSVWGIVSLPDEQHLLSVSHNGDTDSELVISAFVYTSSNDDNVQDADSALEQSRYHRYIAAVTCLSVFGTILAGLAAFFIWRRWRRRRIAKEQRSIQLDITPVTPTSMRTIKSFRSPSKRETWTDGYRSPRISGTSHQPSKPSMDGEAESRDVVMSWASAPGGSEIRFSSATTPSGTARASYASTLYARDGRRDTVESRISDGESSKRARLLRPLVTSASAPSPPSGCPTSDEQNGHLVSVLDESYPSREVAWHSAETSSNETQRRQQVSSMAKPPVLEDRRSTSRPQPQQTFGNFGLPWVFSVSSSIMPAGFNVISGDRRPTDNAEDAYGRESCPPPAYMSGMGEGQPRDSMRKGDS